MSPRNRENGENAWRELPPGFFDAPLPPEPPPPPTLDDARDIFMLPPEPRHCAWPAPRCDLPPMRGGSYCKLHNSAAYVSSRRTSKQGR